ncbi:GDSL-type esterase/lipase family protein [Pontiella sp.]|uniref:GDSL-type esterase/lipase family protein n=1 Tax=Pontiella sp. TaxID=2837462 RepID=UPI0035619285
MLAVWGSAAFYAGAVSAEDRPVRVACVGDSITYGYGIEDRATDSYPARLQALLGDGWVVGNFGKNGATVLKKGHAPYWKTTQYAEALQFRPDVVIIKLGTNDTRPRNLGRYKAEFVPDYLELIRSFQTLESRPTVWVCKPVPIYTERKGMTDPVIRNEIIPLVEAVAEKAGVGIIDLNAVLSNRPELFPDGVHPNAEGAGLMARTVAAEIMEKDKNE